MYSEQFARKNDVLTREVRTCFGFYQFLQNSRWPDRRHHTPVISGHHDRENMYGWNRRVRRPWNLSLRWVFGGKPRRSIVQMALPWNSNGYTTKQWRFDNRKISILNHVCRYKCRHNQWSESGLQRSESQHQKYICTAVRRERTTKTRVTRCVAEDHWICMQCT